MVHVLYKPSIDFESNILKSYDGIRINKSKAKSKTFYDIYIDYDFVYPTFMQKICQDFDIEPNVYLDSLKIMKIFVKERTLLKFHYKVLNTIVASGDNLFKWNIKDSEKCQFCIDTLLHCLWECPKLKDWLKNC